MKKWQKRLWIRSFHWRKQEDLYIRDLRSTAGLRIHGIMVISELNLKNNVKKAWWKKFIQESPFNVGVDCAILMNPQTWIASGHLGGFSDPLMDCKQCHERFRADKVIEDYCAEHNIELDGAVDAWTQEQMKNFIDENQIPCPTCGKHDFHRDP